MVEEEKLKYQYLVNKLTVIEDNTDKLLKGLVSTNKLINKNLNINDTGYQNDNFLENIDLIKNNIVDLKQAISFLSK